MEKKYNFLSRDLDQDKLAKSFEDPDTAKTMFNDPIIAKTLQDEFNSIKSDRDCLRNSIFKMTNDDAIHLPINLNRIIKNAKRMFDVNSRRKSDLKPTDVIQKVNRTLEELCVIPGLAKRRDQLLLDANSDSTLLTRIYLKSILGSKNVILKERLNSQALDWILGEVKSKFE
jgi:DNA-directed RNA polymerase II subunit RPB1